MLESSDLSWNLPIYAGIFRFMLESIDLCWNLPIYVGIYRFMLVSSDLCWNLSIYAGIFRFMLESIDLCWNLPIYTGTFRFIINLEDGILGKRERTLKFYNTSKIFTITFFIMLWWVTYRSRAMVVHSDGRQQRNVTSWDLSLSRPGLRSLNRQRAFGRKGCAQRATNYFRFPVRNGHL